MNLFNKKLKVAGKIVMILLIALASVICLRYVAVSLLSVAGLTAMLTVPVLGEVLEKLPKSEQPPTVEEQQPQENEDKLNTPKITYGEFPVELTYQVNDELVTVNDIYICEYLTTANGEISWKFYLKGHPNESGLLLVDSPNEKVYCYIGSPKYYMGEEKWYRIRFEQVIFSDQTVVSEINMKELEDKYNIKIVEWNVGQPVANEFSECKITINYRHLRECFDLQVKEIASK